MIRACYIAATVLPLCHAVALSPQVPTYLTQVDIGAQPNNGDKGGKKPGDKKLSNADDIIAKKLPSTKVEPKKDAFSTDTSEAPANFIGRPRSGAFAREAPKILKFTYPGGIVTYERISVSANEFEAPLTNKEFSKDLKEFGEQETDLMQELYKEI